jgi:hypothetical protein
MLLFQDDLKEHQEVKIGACEMNFIHYIVEIISLDSSRSKYESVGDTAQETITGPTATLDML